MGYRSPFGSQIDASEMSAAGQDAIAKRHTQGTDQALDTGGANEVTAAQAKAGYTHSGVTTGNPHSVSKSDVGLGDVPNTDCTNADNISSGTLASARMASATTSAQGAVELATVAEANAGSDSTRAVTAAGLLLIKPASPGTAYVGGDLSGGARGNNALDIQSGRSDDVRKASGYSSSAFGYDNRATGSGSSALGYGNEAHYSSSAIGYDNVASGTYSSVFGHRVTTTVNNTCEVGYWSNGTTRAGAVRMHSTGMVAVTLQNRSTEYGDGGPTHGSEADDTLPRECYAIRRNGDDIILDVNIGGTVKNITLGTAS